MISFTRLGAGVVAFCLTVFSIEVLFDKLTLDQKICDPLT